MRYIIKRILILQLFIIVFNQGNAATFTAVANGDWHNPATWGQAILLPASGDDVFIDGFQVTVFSTDVNIFSLTMTNSTGTDSTSLDIKGNGIVFYVQTDILITAENQAQSIQLNISETADVLLDGNLYIERTADNDQNNSLQLNISDEGYLYVFKKFEYIYRNSGPNETTPEIVLSNQAYMKVKSSAFIEQYDGIDLTVSISDTAQFYVTNKINFDLAGGQSLNIIVTDTANITATKNLNLSNIDGADSLTLKISNGASVQSFQSTNLYSSAENNKTNIIIEGTESTLIVNDSLVLDAVSDDDVKVMISSNGSLDIGKNIVRVDANKFGAIVMDNTANLIFNSSDEQIIPRNKYANSGSDSIQYNNISLRSTNDQNFIADGDITIDNNLTLLKGNLITTDTSRLIINDGASIVGGSDSSYVDGPMVKIGSTGGSDFTFPVGDNGKYAPLGITAISDPTLEYEVKFLGCPPPTGVANTPLRHINEYGYWTVHRSDGVDLGDITLHWNDETEVNIDHVSSLVVSYFDETTGWHTSGRKNATSNGLSGSITSSLAIGCPPPTGINVLTFGSTNTTKNVLLPVNMTSFQAYKNNDNTKIFIDWETDAEANSEYFVVEKSYNGIDFHAISSLAAAGNSTTTQFYNVIDREPIKGNNYYRIKQVDMDGTFSFSRLVNVFINLIDDNPIIYPNPVQNHIRLYNETLDGQDKILIKIFSISGSCVYTNWHTYENGLITIPSSDLSIRLPGTYFLNYTYKGRAFNLEFLKINE